MKTLVYVLPDVDAGVASVVRNLLKYKSGRYRTKVILLHNSLLDSKRRVNDDFNAYKIVRISYNGKWSSKYSIYKKIFNELDENSILISNDGGLELEALNYINGSIPVIYIFHGDLKHYFNCLREKRDKISCIITVSDFLEKKVKNTLSIDSDIEVKSIKFPVPYASPLPRKVSKIIRMVFVGSLIDGKGVLSLYEISNLLDKKKVDYQLTIIGIGEKEKELKALFNDNARVNFLGKLDNSQVLKNYVNQDIILLPSLGEGLPVVLVEAMKHGVVPMATNLESGIPELIEHGVNGYALPLKATDEYAYYIEKLHTNSAQLKKMSELCILKAEDMFNPQKQASLYEDAFFETKVAKQQQKKMQVLDYVPMTIALRLKRYLSK